MGFFLILSLDKCFKMEKECPFDILFTKNVPQVLEKILFSLDYMSYRTCRNVSKNWHDLLTSERLQRRMMSVYDDRYWEEQNKLLQLSKQHGTVNEVRRLLSNGMVSVNCRYKSLREAEEGSSGSTPLGEAVAACNIIVAMVLLRAGADPNMINETDKEKYSIHVKGSGREKSQTYLYKAAKVGHLDKVHFFLNLGEDCNQTSGYGDTYLHAAAHGGQKNVVVLLLDRGADPNKTDKSGVTPLDEAVKNGHIGVIEHLLERALRGGYPLMCRQRPLNISCGCFTMTGNGLRRPELLDILKWPRDTIDSEVSISFVSD